MISVLEEIESKQIPIYNTPQYLPFDSPLATLPVLLSLETIRPPSVERFGFESPSLIFSELVLSGAI
jgi:hypothetical protein